MKYSSQNHDVVVNASGGYAVLERLGFKTEEGEMAKKKKAAVKTAEPKKGKLASKAVVEAASEKFRKNVLGGKEKSRNELMLEVKTLGVKNFRVMNKTELAEIVAGAKPDRVEAIMKEAVTRWKAGWTKK